MFRYGKTKSIDFRLCCKWGGWLCSRCTQRKHASHALFFGRCRSLFVFQHANATLDEQQQMGSDYSGEESENIHAKQVTSVHLELVDAELGAAHYSKTFESSKLSGAGSGSVSPKYNVRLRNSSHSSRPPLSQMSMTWMDGHMKLG
jgi:hypothetical protein